MGANIEIVSSILVDRWTWRQASASVGGLSQRKVSTSSSSLTVPDIFKLLGQNESSGYPLQIGLYITATLY